MDLYHLISALLNLPASLAVMMLLGLVMRRRLPRTSVSLLRLATALLIVLSCPLGAHYVIKRLETYPPLHLPPRSESDMPAAIVVLGGGRYEEAPEYGADTVNQATLERVRYAAYLQRATGLPLLAAAGSTFGESVSEAQLMAEALRRDFRVPVRWIETNSRTTLENGLFAQRILAAHKISHVYLVTHAWHMRRAVLSFEQAGLRVTPAPLGYSTLGENPGMLALVPSVNALRKSNLALHEYVGYWWYRYHTITARTPGL